MSLTSWISHSKGATVLSFIQASIHLTEGCENDAEKIGPLAFDADENNATLASHEALQLSFQRVLFRRDTIPLFLVAHVPNALRTLKELDKDVPDLFRVWQWSLMTLHHDSMFVETGGSPIVENVLLFAQTCR